MTDATTPTTPAELLQVGQILILKQSSSGTIIGAYGSATGRFPKGTEVEVKKVGKQSVWLRGQARDRYGYDREYTVSIPLDHQNIKILNDMFEGLDPNAPRPRRIGETPEGAIAVDDPRIAWIWDDAARVATKSNHCSEYDKLCDELGAPGRERNFTIKRTINGFEISKKFKTRSKKLAESMFDSELAAAVPA